MAEMRPDERAERDERLGLRPQYRGMSDAYMRRVAVAMAVAPDVETCAALLRGEPVMRSRLNADALRLLKKRGVA